MNSNNKQYILSIGLNIHEIKVKLIFHYKFKYLLDSIVNVLYFILIKVKYGNKYGSILRRNFFL